MAGNGMTALGTMIQEEIERWCEARAEAVKWLAVLESPAPPEIEGNDFPEELAAERRRLIARIEANIDYLKRDLV